MMSMALYDFDGQEGELSFKVHDTITVFSLRHVGPTSLQYRIPFYVGMG